MGKAGLLSCRLSAGGASRMVAAIVRKGQPVDPLLILAITAGAFLLAGMVKGVIGLGLPTVAIGLLGLVMPPLQAAAILVVPSLVTNIWQTAVGGDVRGLARRLWPLLAGIAIGTFVGATVLPHDTTGQSSVWLGLALAIYAALGLVRLEFKVAPHSETWLGLLMGFLTGTVTVATGIFVLPLTPYVQALQLDRDRMVQALGLSFTASTVTLAPALAYAGEMRTALAVPSLVALVAALLGMVLGQWVRQRVTPQTFRLFFFAGLLLLGLHLASRGLL